MESAIKTRNIDAQGSEKNRTGLRLRRDIRRYVPIYVILILPVALLLIYRYLPMAVQAILAFKDYRIRDGVLGSPWVGLDNFRALVSGREFSRLLKNTVSIALLRLFWEFWPPIILAIFLFDLKSRVYKRFCQTLVYVPHFFSWVIVYAIVFAIFANRGQLNNFRAFLGMQRMEFLLEPAFFRPLLIGSGVWKGLGWGTIIYLAALSNIDPSLFDAAAIDGAGPINRIRHVTLPGMLPVIVFLLTLNIGNLFKHTGAEQILLFYNPATYEVGDVIDTWVYRQGLAQLKYSLGASLQFFQSVFGLILIVTVNHLSTKYAKVGIW